MPPSQPKPLESRRLPSLRIFWASGSTAWNFRLLSILIIAVSLSALTRTFPFQFLTRAAEPAVAAGLVDSEIHYTRPEAREVWLVWGVNGSQALLAGSQPAGTVIKNGFMHTPMAQKGEDFVAALRLPAKTQIDFGFLITRSKDGRLMKVWEADGDRKFHAIVSADNPLIDVKRGLERNQSPGIYID